MKLRYLAILVLTAFYDAAWTGYAMAMSAHNWTWQIIAAVATAICSYSIMFIAFEVKGWKQRCGLVCCGAIGNLIGSSTLLAALEALK